MAGRKQPRSSWKDLTQKEYENRVQVKVTSAGEGALRANKRLWRGTSCFQGMVTLSRNFATFWQNIFFLFLLKNDENWNIIVVL